MVFVEVREPWRTKAGIFAVYSRRFDANMRQFVYSKFMGMILLEERNLYPLVD